MSKHGIQKIEEFIHLAKADLHIHSAYSDGAPSIREILDYVETRTDLDCIAITDHDTITGALEAREIMKQKPYRFELIVGEEISSKEGHILGLFLDKAIPADLSAKEVLKRIHEQKGLAVASHPFENSRFNNPKVINMDGIGAATLINNRHGFDGIEVVNATPTLNSENLRATALNKSVLGLAETGSSDAHILEAIGRGYTLFEGHTAKNLKHAILARQTQAIHYGWSVMPILKYLFFFIPKGFRLAINTIVHGRLPKREDIF
jgi:predicted metal-dependent phosphoesterase TrpH